MNKTRRKKIADVVEQMATQLENLRDLLEEELEYLENVPESLQNSSIYEEASENYGTIEDAVCEIENALQEIIDTVGQ